MEMQTGRAGEAYSQEIRRVTAYSRTQESGAVSAEKETEKGSSVQNKAENRDRAAFSRDTDILKMSEDDRAALVKSLQEDLDNQMARFTNMMTQVFQKQGITAASVQNDGFWKFMASGNYVVDAKTKAEAQAAISEDGYWGVSQTSQRIFDFARAVAGEDADKMREMQAAVEKGFRQAEQAWGGSLPAISGETHSAINRLFDEYYAQYEE